MTSLMAGSCVTPKIHLQVNSADRSNKLHAKFMFVGKLKNERFMQSRLYIGSGNLSKPGFLLAPPMGNIEAGVLIDPEISTPKKLMRALPIGREFKQNEIPKLSDLIQGDNTRAADVAPSPIMVFTIEVDGSYRITWDPNVTTYNVDALLPDGTALALKPNQTSITVSTIDLLRSIQIRWTESTDGTTQICKVPCIAPNGEFKREINKNSSFEFWLDQLLAFPETWNDPNAIELDSEGENDGDDEVGVNPLNSVQKHSKRRSFAAHKAMLMVEAVAERNGSVPEDQSADWLEYLRHMFLEESPELLLKQWQELRINFLSALENKNGFAPPWKDVGQYQSLIKQIASDWKLTDYPAFELTNEQ
jgi:hypothetical protein